MRNLEQFNQRPEEFAQYLKDEKGVNIAGNSGIVKILLIFRDYCLQDLVDGGYTTITKMKKIV